MCWCGYCSLHFWQGLPEAVMLTWPLRSRGVRLGALRVRFVVECKHIEGHQKHYGLVRDVPVVGAVGRVVAF